MLVEKCVLLELKAVRSLRCSHQAQLLNYLRATDIEVGLLLNFGVKPEFKRLLFDNSRKSNSLSREILSCYPWLLYFSHIAPATAQFVVSSIAGSSFVKPSNILMIFYPGGFHRIPYNYQRVFLRKKGPFRCANFILRAADRRFWRGNGGH